MKKYIYLVMLFFTLAIAGCKKSYLDINTNPNSITDAQATPELLLPQALNATATSAGAGGATLARWMGYWSRGGDYGATAEEETYRITTSFGEGTWNAWYNNLYDYTLVQRLAHERGMKFYEGIATAMKTVGWMYLVDYFNDVPYKETFDLEGHVTPKYDKAEDIYKDQFRQLDTALVLMSQETSTPAVTLLNTTDIMFAGDPVLWRKFINTMRLKLLIRLSETTGIVDRNAELARITSDGYLGSGESADVNPGYANSTNGGGASQQNPFWGTYKQDVNGVANDKFNRANNSVLDSLMSVDDIRYQYYFSKAIQPKPNDYEGSNYGQTTANGFISNNQSMVSGPGLAKSVEQRQWMLTSVESLFLQAEALARGWVIGGTGTPTDAKDAYKKAVEESFIWLFDAPVSSPTAVAAGKAAADTYLTSGSRFVTTGVPTVTDVMTQKYYSLVGIANIEAWMDYRRINNANGGAGTSGASYPKPPISIFTNHLARIPLRYLYPKAEYDVNSANVPQTPLTAADLQTTGVFWDTTL